MRNTVNNSAETLKKMKDDIESKDKIKKDYEELLKKNIEYLKEIEQKAMQIYEEISKSKLEEEQLYKEFDEKKKEVEDLKIVIRKLKEEQEKIKSETNETKAEIAKLKKTEKTIVEEILKNKESYKKLIEEFGFIDSFEKEMKKLNSKEDDNIQIDEENNDEGALDLDSQFEQPMKLKKINKEYSKFKDPKFMDIDLVIEELEELSQYSKEIIYESMLTSSLLKKKQHNMDAIKVYKKKVEDLKLREEDLGKTSDKHNKCRTIFDLVKKKRFEEFMEGFNTISSRLKEMYQVY